MERSDATLSQISILYVLRFNGNFFGELGICQFDFQNTLGYLSKYQILTLKGQLAECISPFLLLEFDFLE